jgi:hypothetical protein
LAFNFDYFVFCERINLILLSNIDLIVFNFSFLEHLFVFSVFFFNDQEGLLTSLPPDSNRLISWYCHEKVTNTWDCDWPNLTKEVVKYKHFIMSISIKKFNRFVLGARHNVMSIFDKLNICDWILMSKNRFMDVTEIKTPDFNVLICRARN